MQVEWEIEGRVGQAKSRIGKPTDWGSAKPSWRVNAQEGQQELSSNNFVDLPPMLYSLDKPAAGTSTKSAIQDELNFSV